MNKVTIELDREKIEGYMRDVQYGKLTITSRECKHATYSRDRSYQSDSDMLTVKEWITFSNGVRAPNVRLLKDYKRPYWVTKKPLRTHPEKIEFEDMKNLDMFRSTQSNLAKDICFRLGHGNPKNPIRMLARSPYLYGLDVGPEAFVKESYFDNWPNGFVPNDVTVFDAETDVTADFKKPILWSRVTDQGAWLYVSKEWANTVPNYADHVRNEYMSILPIWLEPIKKKLGSSDGSYPPYLDIVANMPLYIIELDDFFDITKAVMDDIHSSHTDILTGWNVIYDASTVAESCVAAGKDPIEILSDPKVPHEFKSLYLKKGADYKVSASGVKTNLGPQERWDTMLSTSTFRIIDAMQVHWQLRKAMGKESGGYALDALMTRHLGAGKVTCSSPDSIIPVGTIRWHGDMQANFKVQYGVYSIFDSILPKIKDWKDSDLSQQISSLAGSCDYSKFNSQPTVNATDMLFSGIKDQKKVICSTSDNMESELDSKTIPLDGWIVTFPSFNVSPSGVHALKGLPDVQSTIYTYCSDADVETTYPVSEIINNMSRDTTVAEPVRIKDVTRADTRIIAVNITGGPSNALEILQHTAKVPVLSEWLEEMRRERAS